MKAHGAKEMNTFLITGATSGLGLEVARKIAAQSRDNRIITGVRPSSKSEALKAAIPDEQLMVFELDLSSVASVSKLMEGASSAKKSGSTLTNILLGNMPQLNSGVYVNFKGDVVESSEISYEKAAQDALIAFADQTAAS